MPTKPKNLKFAFFKPKWRSPDGSISDFDFSDWMEDVESVRGKNQSWFVQNIGSILLSRCKSETQDIIMYSLFVEKKGIPPQKFRELEEPTGITLEEDEKFVEPMYILYDSRLKIAMIQISKSSLRIADLENWINWETSEGQPLERGGHIILSEIYSDNTLQQLQDGKLKSLSLSIELSPDSSDIDADQSLFGSLKKISDTTGSNTIDIQLKAGEKGKYLHKGPIIPAIQFLSGQAQNKPKAIARKIMAKIEDALGNPSDIDLLGNTLRITLRFSVQENHVLEQSDVFEEMARKYRQKRVELERITQYH